MFIESPNDIIAGRIKQLRAAKQFTQRYMAYALQISQATYCDLENGITELKVNTLVKISQVLGVSVNELLNDKHFIPPPHDVGQVVDPKAKK
jgi:transcriptional regulator with XRE-family HTH domain